MFHPSRKVLYFALPVPHVHVTLNIEFPGYSVVCDEFSIPYVTMLAVRWYVKDRREKKIYPAHHTTCWFCGKRPAPMSIDRYVFLAPGVSSMSCSVLLSECYIVAPTFHTDAPLRIWH